jgi:hypothetical protein
VAVVKKKANKLNYNRILIYFLLNFF